MIGFGVVTWPWLATDWLLYMIKPEGSDLSGFISIKEAETID